MRCIGWYDMAWHGWMKDLSVHCTVQYVQDGSIFVWWFPRLSIMNDWFIDYYSYSAGFTWGIYPRRDKKSKRNGIFYKRTNIIQIRLFFLSFSDMYVPNTWVFNSFPSEDITDQLTNWLSAVFCPMIIEFATLFFSRLNLKHSIGFAGFIFSILSFLDEKIYFYTRMKFLGGGIITLYTSESIAVTRSDWSREERLTRYMLYVTLILRLSQVYICLFFSMTDR